MLGGNPRIIVIYHGHGGTIAPAVCAAIHAGLLPETCSPTADDILGLDGSRVLPRDQAGRIRRSGESAHRGEIYFLANRAHFAVLERAIRQIARELGTSTDDVVYVDVMPHTNLAMRLGGLVAQSLGLGWLGRKVSAWGVLSAYPRLVDAVRRTRAALGESGAPTASSGPAGGLSGRVGGGRGSRAT